MIVRDKKLLQATDRAMRPARQTRQFEIHELEERDRLGYERQPDARDEWLFWEEPRGLRMPIPGVRMIPNEDGGSQSLPRPVRLPARGRLLPIDRR